MNKVLTRTLLAAVTIVSLTFFSCKSKPKDADIKAAAETALKADPTAAGTMVSVEKGVATITGECKDEACKTHCAELVKSVKGVKEVINNCTIAAAPPAPVVNPEDEVLTKAVTDALKDHPGVSFEIKDGKIVLIGEIAKAKWLGVKQMLDKLQSKGYDLSKLTIK
ncbi:MAG TPA: BON domain-containing protein [Chitinophagaceae bacterium]|nr:BON domain-containing protein [Chitinophagaceae bacterium]